VSYDENGNKIKSSGADGFMIIDFSKFHDVWVNVDNDAEPETDLDALVNSIPPREQAPKIPADWRDRAYETDLVREIRRQRIVKEAREILLVEDVESIEVEEPVSATDFLAQPDNPTVYRVDQLWPIGGNVLFAAAAKFGKSTIVMNLVRSLLDGDAFLGCFECPRISDGEKVLLVDLEMSADRVRSELRVQDIQNPAPLLVACLRGKAKQFDITNPEVRAKWVEFCHEHNVKTLIIDPLAPLFGYLNIEENDNTSVNRFFQQLDEFKMECGIRDMLVTHHCGHTSDWRPRGASRFNDWPEGVWLAKHEDITDPNSSRKFFVRGRDVGEGWTAPGEIQRDLNNPKVLIFDAQSQQAQAAQALRGMIENLVYTHKGKDKNYLLPLAQAQDPSLDDRKLDAVLRDLVNDGMLHAHPLSTGSRGRPPLHYWPCDDCACSQAD
jgi:hypothetical protein